MSGLSARITGLEQAVASDPIGCVTFRDWPTLMECLGRLCDGDPEAYRPWHKPAGGGDAHCPDCGREPQRPRVPVWQQIVEAGDAAESRPAAD